MNINNFQLPRYFITGLSNGGTSFNIQSGNGSISVSMSTTYSQLIEKHTARLQLDYNTGSLPQVARNHLTALRSLLRSINKSETSPIGSELTTDFVQSVRTHLASASLSDRSKADRRSLLNAWKVTFDQMAVGPEVLVRGRERKNANVVGTDQTPFERGLKSALKAAKLTPKTAARLANASPSALGRWSRGALPNERSTQSLVNLDRVMGLPEGTLQGWLQETHAAGLPLHVNEFRERVKSTPKLMYSLKVQNISPSLLAEWRALFEHKTAAHPKGHRRNSNGRWTMVDVQEASCAASAFNSFKKKVAPSADILWTHVSNFIGFLQLSTMHGGYGLPEAETQTLAWLAVPEAIEAYLEFMTDRSDGLKHGGHRTFCGYVAALNNPSHGYLLQSPEFASRLPDSARTTENWEDRCRNTFETARAWKADSQDISRDPASPLKYFLDQEFPLAPIFAAMRKLRRISSEASAKSRTEALARRDELILGLLVSNPLRAKNIKTLIWKIDNSGNVYRTPSGEWRIRILGRQFKNRRRVGKTLYDVPVAKWLSKLVEDYVNYFRKTLIGDAVDSGFFFVSSRDGGRLNSLNSQVYSLTKALIPQCGAFRLTHFDISLLPTGSPNIQMNS